MLKAYEYRIYPSISQKMELAKAFGSCRFVYNKALAHKKNTYESSQTSISYNTLATTFLKTLKQEFPWLREAPSQGLQQSLRHLDSAYKNFFRKTGGFPNFKSKFARQSISYPQFVTVDFNKSTLSIPKLGKFLAIFHRTFDTNISAIKTCTLTKSKTGKYFISILVDDHLPTPEKILFTGKDIALDLGIKHFYTPSHGDKIENPKFYDQALPRLKRLQRILSLKKKGSNNYRKLKLVIARIHEKIVNQRDNFLHQLSSKVINDNQVIFLEDLGIKDMMQEANTSLARNIGDVSWSKFVSFLKYKAEWRGKRIIQIGRYEPSSKKCSVCGKINEELKLSDREWQCSCGALHDRDVNAAKNILTFGRERAEFKSLEIASIGSACL